MFDLHSSTHQEQKSYQKTQNFADVEHHNRYQIRRLHLLLTEKESAMDVPANLEARTRISFFSNSLFMDMPVAPKVRNMILFEFFVYGHACGTQSSNSLLDSLGKVLKMDGLISQQQQWSEQRDMQLLNMSKRGA